MRARSPAPRGYRLPAEWEPHAATWLAWPHERSDWPGKFATIQWVYGEVVRHLMPGERVHILVDDARAERSAAAVLRRVGVDPGHVGFVRIRTDRSWTRDSFPLFLRRENGDVGLSGWRFNGWARYGNWRRDAAVPAALARVLRRPLWTPRRRDGTRFVLEGGSIDVNGRGALLTTEECLLDPVQARNPGATRGELEQVLGAHLGVRKVLWLGRGIAGDDTHGHVDDVARFVDADTIVFAAEDDPTDVNFEALRENRIRLSAMTNQDGRPFRTVALPMPAPLFFGGQRLPASYCNFYIGNEVVLVPTFNDPRDRDALGVLADLFPGRRVIGIHAGDLVLGLGTLHCMTQQEPA